MKYLKGLFLFLLFVFIPSGLLSQVNLDWLESITIDKQKSSAQASNSKENDSKNIEFAVSLIEAIHRRGTDKVLVSWMDIEQLGMSYKIYRFNRPIDNLEILRQASFRGRVQSGMQQFEDTLEKSGKYYYAVVTSKDNKEFPVLMYEQSYTTNPVAYQIKSQDFHVVNLNAVFNQFLTTVLIRWDDPQIKKKFNVLVYRSGQPIDSLKTLEKSTLIATLPQGEGNFKDRSVQSGNTYYYAVMLQLEMETSPELIFIPDMSFTTREVFVVDKGSLTVFGDGKQNNSGRPDIEEQVTNPLIDAARQIKVDHSFYRTENLKVDFDEKEKYISIKWQAYSKIPRPFYFNIYRSLKPIREIDDLRDGKNILDNLSHREAEVKEKFEYRDYKIVYNTDYYYAILVDTGEGLKNQRLLLLDNYIKYPVRIFKEETAQSISSEAFKQVEYDSKQGIDEEIRSQLKRIVKEIFLKQEYRYALSEFQPFDKKNNLSRENKKILLTFMGRSHLALDDRDNALSYFIRLKELDEEGGQFWIDQTVAEQPF